MVAYAERRLKPVRPMAAPVRKWVMGSMEKMIAELAALAE